MIGLAATVCAALLGVLTLRRRRLKLERQVRVEADEVLRRLIVQLERTAKMIDDGLLETPIPSAPHAQVHRRHPERVDFDVLPFDTLSAEVRP